MSDFTVLSVNAGSSSLKVARFAFDGDEPRPLDRVEVAVHDGDHGTALARLLDGMAARGAGSFSAVGHRVVHGGPNLSDPVFVDREVRNELGRLLAFAPLHLPAALAGMDLLAERTPDVSQVACFDTAFHRTIPEVAQRFPLPDTLWQQGVRRYGFHGLSYEYVVGALGDSLGRRAVVAHLGNGASMVALRDRVSVDTTMGFTPTGGLVMGTRTGDLDPGVIVYLLRAEGLDAHGLEELVDHESGLKALSGGTSDMQALLEARDHDARARLAVDVFCDRVRKAIGGYAATLGGLDTLVFTGGIGEHAAAIRSQVCDGLEFLGIEIDADRNLRGDATIGRGASSCDVRIVAADEDVVIARHTRDVVMARSI